MKIGIEIHQRLASHKLFCECTSDISDGEQPSLIVMRQLRPVMSELKEIDAASRAEFAKRKIHEYQVFDRNNCLVEIDEEPPHPLNQDALEIALKIAMHLHAKPVDEVHFMRKIIIDGSAVSGFQRTAVIAMDGFVETSRGKITIQQLSLEEESSGIVADTSGFGKSIFRLDRLGIPLVEITTSADIIDGPHLLEVAEKLGTIMRATGKVARGLGTIRQDVNVSTEGGARVEIKGAQDLKMLSVLVEQEVLRQKNLLTILDTLNKRYLSANFTPSSMRIFATLTGIFNNTASKLIKSGISSGQQVVAIKLPHNAGLLGTEIQSGRRCGTELSDYAKTAGVKGIIHSDEDMNKYTISESEVAEIKKALGIGQGKQDNNDAFVLVVAEHKTAEKALEKVCERAEMLFIPKETRRANPDGSTSYMRPLPGRARMYPETDIPPVQITKDMIAELQKTKGESLEGKKARLLKILNPEMAERMIKSKNLGLFEQIVGDLGIEPMLVANTLENTLVSLRREGAEIRTPEVVLPELFGLYKKDRFVKAAIPEILKLVAGKGEPGTGKPEPRIDIESAIRIGKLEKISGNALEKIAKENNYEIGKIMQKYRLNVEAGELGKLRKK
ncbi:TPA: Glu-tRNA(Gln) amidotransferase subunit GatE [Candidatus Micrarchaeota archaeon]|nr:Glu-tRNA(Gln) amidotransferase subunit GatE [Candidatus Micrarchaeota archaeon]